MSIRCALAVFLLVAALPAGAVSLPPEGVVADGRRSAQQGPRAVRHPVAVDTRRFAAMAKGTHIALPSSDGAELTATFSRLVEHGDGRRTWIGKVSTPQGEQSALLTFDGAGNVFGWIPQRRGLPLRLETRAGSQWLVEGAPAPGRLDDDVRVPAAGETIARAAGGPVPKVTVPGLGDVPQVDVLVAYTPDLVEVWGDDGAVHTRIAFLGALSNQVYVDSDAAVQIRIVGRERVEHPLPGGNNDTLDRITDPSSDPAKVQVDAARAAAHADLVVLMTSGADVRGSCGVAWLQGKPSFDAAYAFAVVNDHSLGGDADCWEITFPHEVGHLMGSHHDNTTSQGAYGAYPYSRGHRSHLPGGHGFATVMAYPAEFQEYVALLSNPRLDCSGVPCGVDGFADNARSHTTAAPGVAAFVAGVPQPVDGLSIADARITEQHSGTRQLKFTVSRSGDRTAAASFAIRALPGTAQPTSDYVVPGGTRYTIAAGAASTTVGIAITGDRVTEKAETFSVMLVEAQGAPVVDGLAVGTIDDDDAGVYVADATIAEGPAGIRQVTLTAHVTQGAPGPVSFRLRTVDGEAKAGSDFIAIDRALTIPAGESSAQFTLRVLGDIEPEEDETLSIAVADVVNATVFDPEATVTLVNDDAGFQFLDHALHVLEGTGGQTAVSVTVRRFGPQEEATLGYVLEADTGTPGVDVGPVQGTFVFGAGLAYASFNVMVAGDSVDEPHERVRIRLVSDRHAVPGTPLDLTIADDDGGPPQLSIDDAEPVDEGTSHRTSNAYFTVSVSEGSAEPISFESVFVAETADADDVWYYTRSHTLSPGETSVRLEVEMRGDSVIEADETYRIELRNVSGAVLADGSGAGVVRNDDHGWPVVWLDHAWMDEGGPGQTTKMRFRLRFDRPALAGTTGRVVIGVQDEFSESAHEATPGVDMAASVPFPAIAAGQTEAWIDVPVYGDGDIENDESFRIELADVVNMDVFDQWTRGTIENDDYPWHEISAIQGGGLSSPLASAEVSTQGVVTALTSDWGVILQQEGGGDGDRSTSDAIYLAVDGDTFAVGDRLRVGGRVHEEFFNDGSRATTLIFPTIQRLARGVPVPAPVPVDRTMLHQATTPSSLQPLEWMRIVVKDAVVVGPGGQRRGLEWEPGYVDGLFDVVAPGLPRPHRGPGLDPDARLSMPATVVPDRWYGNAEILRVDPRLQRGGGDRPVDAGDTFPALRGVLWRHAYDGHRLALEPNAPASASGATPTTAALPGAGDLGIGWLDLDTLSDVDDGAGAGIPASDYALRLAKLARLACGVLRHPEVIVVDGVQSGVGMQDLADALNEAAVAQPGQCDAAPGYVGFIPAQRAEAPSPQLGLLVRTDDVAPGTARVSAGQYVEIGRDARFTDPYFSPYLFERPPLVTGLVVRRDDGSELPLTLVAVSMRDAAGSESGDWDPNWPTQGARTRAWRADQAVALAEWLQARQSAAPTENLVVVGDFQALDGGDGLVDVLGIVRGGALPQSKVMTWRASPVARPLVDIGARLHASDRWDSVLDGTTVAYAHALVSAPLAADAGIDARIEYPRVNADFAIDHDDDPALPLRAASRDPLLLRLGNVAGAATDLHVWYTTSGIDGGAPGARRLVAHVDNRGPAAALQPQLVLVVGTTPKAVFVTAPAGWTCAELAISLGTRVTCRGGAPLAAGDSARFTLEIAATAEAVVPVTLRVSSATPDPVPANDRVETSR